MKTAKLFQNGKSQAVRLPKEFRMDGNEVYIKRQGEAIILLPKKTAWDSLINSLNHFSKDFRMERNQPEADQTRETLFE